MIPSKHYITTSKQEIGVALERRRQPVLESVYKAFTALLAQPTPITTCVVGPTYIVQRALVPHLWLMLVCIMIRGVYTVFRGDYRVFRDD